MITLSLFWFGAWLIGAAVVGMTAAMLVLMWFRGE